jgi:prepilin-type processing-associated H-X9-DG protein
MGTANKPKKLTHVEILVVVLLCLFLIAIALPASVKSRSDYFRQSCWSNLSKIGKAMVIYANDYEDQLPRAGGRSSVWGPSVRWDAANRFSAYGISPQNGSGGQATISSSLYFLVKYSEVEPSYFICPGDSGTTEFKLSDYPNRNPTIERLIDAWDFGPEPWKHCSYSYHMPYCAYFLTASSEPGMAVAADRNPWIRSAEAEAKDFRSFKPDIPPWNGTTNEAKYGNSFTHEGDGQNVLFLDGHVSFKERSYCGVEGDNIYTFLPGGIGHPQLGIPPIPFVSEPGHNKDSFLVHDPAQHRETITKQTEAIDSANLKQTLVVATLDCPIPEHKSTIWCSTFQIAWNKLKDDIIGEPIKVLGAEELAARLNQAKVSETDLEEKSYYATAGFVKDGILEQIQQEMAKRFPPEPKPEFDERYRTLPDPIVAYSHINIDVGFKYPFHDNKGAFAFEDSNGTRTGVKAFCGQASSSESDLKQAREQVEILYYKFGDNKESDEFAVDLCKHTQPYQVVLACMPRRNTLGEALIEIEQKISEFKKEPDYEALCRLWHNDTLIVPDVFYKLRYHFKELLGKYLGNQKWQDYFFFEAMQIVDFSLNRTGVILKSEARIGMARSAAPRRFHFDKPFLIYVKKRGEGTSPFFVMWVDNAELMPVAELKEFK